MNRSIILFLFSFALVAGLAHAQGAVPDEVTGLRFGPDSTLQWEPPGGIVGYDVLVAEDGAFSLGVGFLARDLQTETVEDPFVPLPGLFRTYLVRGFNDFGAGSWGGDSSGTPRLALDSDADTIADSFDICPGFYNPLQVDLDNDGLGDPCDNCPTEPNPDQIDSNNDGGGDACQPPDWIDVFCDTRFFPEPGIAPELFAPDFGFPEMEGVIHPVIQFSMALMEPERTELAALGITLNEFLDYNIALGSVRQDQLQDLGALRFVRSVFPVPDCYRVGERSMCDPFRYGDWSFVQGPFEPPPARSGSAMVYDGSREALLHYGGDASGGGLTGLYDDTYLWDGSQWQELFPTNKPPALSEHAMAWFTATKQTVMFGGYTPDGVGGIVLSDQTWIWDDTGEWTQLFPTNQPTPRHDHAMADERLLGQVVLFGGFDDAGAIVDDTWIFDGGDWFEMFPDTVPGRRWGHAMAWDQGSGRVLMYGGIDPDGKVLDDLWAWDGAGWELLEVSGGPGPRVNHAMTSRWDLCGIVLYGGQNDGGSFLEDTWFFNGTDTWMPVTTSTIPGPIADAALAYDAVRERYLLFGGNSGLPGNPTSETWRLEPATLHHVVFHNSVPDSIANQILFAANAIVIEDGVQIPGGQRLNTWYAAVPDSMVASLAAYEPVLITESANSDSEDNDGSTLALRANNVQVAPYCGGAGCSGNGVTVSQWDTGWPTGDATFTAPGPALPVGTTHAALTGRVTVRDFNPSDPLDPTPAAVCASTIDCTLGSWCYFSDHATHVAGTMLGNGAGGAAFAGLAGAIGNNVAYGLPSSAAEATCELNDAATLFNARLAVNSWGWVNAGSQAGRYDAMAQSYDLQIAAQPQLAVFFSAGNWQNGRNANGLGTAPFPSIYTPGTCMTLPGIMLPPSLPIPAANVAQRFFTITGGSKAAKNTFVIGSINSGNPSNGGSYGRMTLFSSWGPTQDGRIKPDLVTAGAEDNQRATCPCGFVCGGVLAAPPPVCDPDPLINSSVCTTVTSNICNSVGTQYGVKRGTSMAAPAAVGASALLLEESNLNPVPGGSALDTDSLKAILVHTAVDLAAHFPPGGNFMGLQDCEGDGDNDDCWPVPAINRGAIADGPDYVNGWGLIDIQAALDKYRARNPRVTLRPTSCANSQVYDPLPFNSPLVIGGDPASIGISGCGASSIWDWVGYVEVPSGTTQLRVTISWEDQASPPATNGSATATLINDLDLIVTPYSGIGGSPTGPHNYGWILDPACPYNPANQISTSMWSPATYSDQRNTVEQVIVNAPAPGTYRIVVQGIGLSTPTQPFAIAISMPPSNP